VPDLIEAIRQDRCLHVRSAASEALGLVGDGCELTTAALQGVLRDSKVLVREIEQALQRLVRPKTPARPLFIPDGNPVSGIWREE
jgi:hypothetical protein